MNENENKSERSLIKPQNETLKEFSSKEIIKLLLLKNVDRQLDTTKLN